MLRRSPRANHIAKPDPTNVRQALRITRSSHASSSREQWRTSLIKSRVPTGHLYLVVVTEVDWRAGHLHADMGRRGEQLNERERHAVGTYLASKYEKYVYSPVLCTSGD